MADAGSTLGRVSDILGGPEVLARELTGPLDAHDLLLRGLPGAALTYLLTSFTRLEHSPSLERAVGMSARSLQRRKSDPEKLLSREQSGRTWKFAEILAKATLVFGSRGEAEQWLDRPAMGLDQHRPIELLTTPAGVEIVEDYLERLEHGVYM